MADVVIVNAKTGERIERDFTPEELARREADAAAAAEREAELDAQNEKREADLASAMEKLAALGLNQNEIKALTGE